MYLVVREDNGYSHIARDFKKAEAYVNDMLKRFPHHRFYVGPVTVSAGATVSPPEWKEETHLDKQEG